MGRSFFTEGQRFTARVVLLALLCQWTVPAAVAAQTPAPTQEPAPLPLASTITSISSGATSTFIDATLVGRVPADFVGKWIRVFTADQPAGLIIEVIGFDSQTGQISLRDKLPAGEVAATDVYHLAASRDVLLPTTVDPASIGPGSIGCTPSGTNHDDRITCFAIDTTGVDAKKGDDTVAVTSRTIVLVTKFGPDQNGNATGAGSKDSKTDATAISLGDGNDRIVNDGTVVSAAIAVASGAPAESPSGKQLAQKSDPKVAAKAEAEAAGIAAGEGQNVVTNNGTLSTSATALVLARQIPDDGKPQKSGDVSSSATTTSTAIETGDDGSFITNTGRLTSRAIAVAAGAGMSLSTQGAAGPSNSTSPNNFTVKADVEATATASGITAGSGHDTVTNTNNVVVTASAVTLEGAATQIETQGKGTVTATAQSTSTAQGILLGDGNDILINSGTIATDATSYAVSVALGVADKNNSSPSGAGSNGSGQKASTPASKELESSTDASATAKAEATGIAADAGKATPESDPIFKLGSGNLTVGLETTETRAGGNDSVINSGTIDVNALSRAVTGAAGIAIDGNASVNVTSKAETSAVGVDLGAGNDSSNNTGTITSVADAAATAIGVAVAQKATSSSSPAPPGTAAAAAPAKPTPDDSAIAIKAVVEGSASATSTAVGITADGALSTRNDNWTATASLNRTFEFARDTQVTQASGTDTVTNSGAIGALATAATRAGSVGIAADGAATIKATSTSDATARSIDLGAGNDTVTNTTGGQLTANAMATANALSLAVGFKTDPSVKAEVESAASVDTIATARATGVSADGVEADSRQTINLSASGSQLSLAIEKTTTLASGDDVVTNNGAITTTAAAITGAAGIAAGIDGKATVTAVSTATGESAALDLGRGNDTLTNTGAIDAVANANATALGIAVGVTGGSSPPPSSAGDTTSPNLAAAKKPTTPPPAPPPSLESTADASAVASATAVGVSADSLAAEVDRRLQLQIGGGPSFITVSEATVRPGGDDTVTNSGTVDVAATAASGALAMSVTTDGKAAAKLTSTAAADAAGIDLGGGNDTLTNTAGTVTVTADALARALSAAIGIKSDPNAKSTAESTADASVGADARAVGIAADALKTDSTISVTIQHLEGVLSLSGQGSLTRPAGDDMVTNAADIVSRATATSRELGLGVAIDGSTTAKTASTATALAAGIDLGGGSDRLVANTGDITTEATATGSALGLAIGVKGSSSGSGTSTASSSEISANAEPGATPVPDPPKATAAETKAAVDGSVTATATAVGVAADSPLADANTSVSLSLPQFRPQLHVDVSQTYASGDDTLTNDGTITTTAMSTSRALGVGASVGGDVTVKTTSEASATGVGIDLGGGHDTLTNNGAIGATSTAVAEAVNLSLVLKPDEGSSGASASGTPAPQRAKSSVDASATADARAIGLAADSAAGDTQLTVDLTVGNSLSQGAVFGFLKSETRASGDDHITNTADVEANASATTTAAGIGLSAEGTASARTSSTAEASAAAIDLGAGADFLWNAGTLKAFATAISGGLNVALTNKGTSTSTEGFFAASEGLWKGGIDAKATAIGIDGAGAAAKSTSLDIALGGNIGVDVRFQKLEDGVTADAADRITNSGNINAVATAVAGSLNVAASAKGSAGAVSDLESEARATGIQGGHGDDVIDNLGPGGITLAIANAATAGATVAVSSKGLSVAADTLWSTGTKGEATAIGINGDGGRFELKDITFLGTELVIKKLESGATGNDVIANQQTVVALADATAPSLGVSFEAEKGVAATLSSVETTAAATAIRGGGGDDRITNTGLLVAGASALSAAANIAIAKVGVAAAGGAIWDGGTKAEATAVGIDADGVATSTKTTTMTVSTDGVSLVHEKQEDTVSGAGADTVRNFAGITATARAESDTLAVAGTTKGVSAAFGQSTTEATAAAIRGGAGNDTIVNAGALNMIATSIARALNVSVETTGGVAIAGNGVWDGGTTAEARATGIAGDGGSTKTTTTTISIGGGDFIGTVKTDVAATGDDTITNTARIEALADATARQLSAAVPIKGLGVAISTSTADAVAAAIDAGPGDDIVTNGGDLKSTANATATTANVAFTRAGVALAADAVWNGGTTARSTASGITAGEGLATVTNHGAIEANSHANALSGSVAVAVSGVAGATATSTATSRAVGIELGNSDATDTLINTGAITIDALAQAATAAVSVTNAGLAISADSVWNGGTRATSVARGIADTGGPDVVRNGGRIEVGSTAETGSATVAVAVSGVAVALGTATADANASAIDLGQGADLLINRGPLVADAFALAGTVNVSVTTAGVAAAGNDVWDGGTKAQAAVRTISAGSGDDVLINAGDVNATSTATTVAVPVSVAVSGVGVAIGTSTATSVATAIDGGDGANTITNRDAGVAERSGKLVADATANAVTATVAVTTAGVAIASDAVWNGGTTADAAARGIRTSVGGDDTIDNESVIDATSTARSGSGNVAVAVTGVAVALANSTALSNAAAIDTSARADDAHFTGADADTVINRGALTVNANAFALSLPVSVAGAGVAVAGNSVWDGGTTADAKAKGITTGVGDDVIANSAAILADADGTSGSAAVSVSGAGFAASVATSTAKASAAAIDAGEGADRVTNTGRLNGDTKALAGTVTVAVTPAGVAVAGDAVWDGGTKAEAMTRTLDAGGGADRVRNEGDVLATAVADTASVAVSVAVAGVGVTSATSTATAEATAIDLGAGDDTVVNRNGGLVDRTGKLTADATANAVAASVTVTPAGVAIASDAVWRGGTTANATAAGIDGGLGRDTVVNTSDVDVDSTARTGAVSAAVTVFGVSAALVNSTANASGAGIKTGDDVRDADGRPVDMDLATENDLVVNSGALVVDVDALATSLGIGFTFGGFSAAANALWDGGTTANGWAWGISLGNGADQVMNDGLVDIASFANADAVSFGVTVFGVSAAGSTATGNARSTALDGGDGNDVVKNLEGGTLISDATSTARGASVGFVAIGASVSGDTAWNGGTKADAVAKGADGGLGNDIVTNDGTIDAKADSTALSAAVTITGIGVGGGIATSTSTATAKAIDGGDGEDTITNTGDATATALSTATGVAVTATGVGAGGAFDSFFNGGTTAVASATGLAGGAGDDVVTQAAKTVTAVASSDTLSTSVAVTLVGLAVGAAASTATANATAIDGGAGADTILVDSALVSNATATAAGNSVTVSSLGSIAGGFDSVTKAESVTVGVAGGDDDDTITLTDKAVTSLASSASTRNTSVAVTLAGGLSDSQAMSTARATGITGGAGNDLVMHAGAITGTLAAESKARGVTVDVVGPLPSTDVSSRSQIVGSGIDGDAGDDTIVNGGQIDLTGTATARGNAVTVAGGGLTDATAVSTSDATLTGVRGGDGADTIANAIGGNVSVDSTAQTFANGVSFALTVAGRTDTQTTPTATATGLDGGAGDDHVVNNAFVNARAHSASTATGSSIALIGGAATSAGTQATADATGLAGGLGDDLVENRSLANATALSEASVSDSSWTLGGGSGNSSLFNATGLSVGMSGGAGLDRVLNEAFIGVSFMSTLRATGGSDAIFGGANANTQLAADGGAIGMAGGADNDVIWNVGTGIIDVDATADVGATKTTVSFVGSPLNAALLSAHANATGLDGGSGNNLMVNDGAITVRATGLSNISGGAEATVIGGTKSNGSGTADATALGIYAEDGDNVVTNAGMIDLLARGDAVTINSSTSGLLFSTGTAKSDARSTVDAFGIVTGAGNSTLINDTPAELIVRADASAYANAYASGAHVSIKGAATTTADSVATSTAVGMKAQGGANTVLNRGLVSVLATAGTTRDITRTDSFCSTEIVTTTDDNGNEVKTEVFTCKDEEIPVSSSPTYAAANGNGANGVGRGTATATARANAFGVQVGDGSNVIENWGGMSVTARPDARAIAFADGDLLAEAFGTATGTATATAVGIQAGDGNNGILNAGTLTVLAEPAVRVSVDVTTAAPVCINYFFGTWCGDGGIGTATATASFSATAVGIQVGGGSNSIVNDGLLSVTAAPATGDPISITHADPPRHESTTIAASAIGIKSGNGDNTIVNSSDGVIDVAAKFPQACTGSCSLSLSAVGIQTGSGNDTIVNDGTLKAAIVNGSGTQFTTAIDAGGGDDRVVLGANSQTMGTVLLGAGDDRLVWGAGASLTGTVAPGAGFNTFALGGSVDGTLNLTGTGPIGGMNVFSAFDDFRKEGPSIWTLTGARAMNWTVEGGTLAISGALTGTVATAASDVVNPTIAVATTGSVTSPSLTPAIRLETGGALFNDGHVTGGANGVELSGVGDLLVNRGTIAAAGVAVRSLGSLGTIVNEGLIDAGGTAVLLGTDDTLINTGTISSATGVAVQGGGGSQQVTNLGLLSGGAGVALDLGAGDDTLTLIGSPQFNGIADGGNGTDKLILGGIVGNLDVSEIGTFNSFENVVMDASLWTLAGRGAIDLTVNQGLLNVAGNVTGTIETAAPEGRAAILVGAAGSITGNGGAAVVLQDSNMLVNTGLIDGSINALGDGSAVLNVGAIANQSGVTVFGGDGAQTIVNEGLIASGGRTAIDLGAGDDVLQLGTAARLGGDARGGTGFDTLTLAGEGSVRLDLGAFDGFERLRKVDAGLWMLTGSRAMTWGADAGTLVLDGARVGRGSIEAGARLAGNGQVGSLTNAGIVSPGMSIGAITVAGDYVQTKSGVLQVEGTIVTGIGDRLNVTGRATLDGTLELLPESRSFGIATEYSILEAREGVKGTFAATTSAAPNLDVYVDYLPKAVTVALVRNDVSFEAMGGTANLQALGRSLDASKRSMAHGDFKGVMDEFLTVDAQAQASALGTLSGEVHASLPTTLLRIGDTFFSASTTRRVSAEQHGGGRVTVWTDYLRFTGDLRGSGGFAGVAYGASGLVGGVDVSIGHRARAGASFGYAHGTNDLDSVAAGNARVRSRMPAAYGEYAAGPVLVEGAFGYAGHAVQTERQVEVGLVRRQALADYTADQYSGLMRVSVALPGRRGLGLAPFFETRRSQLTRGGFDEVGAGSVSLAGVEARTTNSARTVVGLRTRTSSQLRGVRVEPLLSVAWTREGRDLRSGMQAALSGMLSRSDSLAFALSGAPDSRSGGLVDAGVSMSVPNHGRAFVAYDGLLTGKRTEHSLAAGLSFVW